MRAAGEPPIQTQPLLAGRGALDDLVASWRREADHLRARYGLDELARLCDAHASELSVALAAAGAERLTLKQAAAESGYSTSHLRAMIASGALTNAGRKGSPRLLRQDLPSRRTLPKAARRPRRSHPRQSFDVARLADSLAQGWDGPRTPRTLASET